MPEFYDQCNCRYQPKAQPYLDAIARGLRDDYVARSFLLLETEHCRSYEGAEILWSEQWHTRDPRNRMKSPFWSNYWYEPCPQCDCRIDNSVSMEIDAMFFFRKSTGKTLAIHIEMKRFHEPLSIGQAEAYRPRAGCFRDQRRSRKTLLPHDDFVTVLFCENDSGSVSNLQYFDRVIAHADAAEVFLGYPER